MKDWFLLYCKRSEQERAVINLDRQGVECYYPQVSVNKIVRGKRVETSEPLFPSYIFVYFDPEHLSYTTVRSTRGVADFIRQGARPQMVQQELVYGLMMNENCEDHQAKLSSLPIPGECLQLKQGQFKGIEAIYQEADGEKRSFMLINLLGKPVKVSVENEDIVKD
ncbi:transcription/translation regulatory transformer protein RfaH [Photobacterium profundum]|jgi:transcriptional antiterminator RfaH|uniref:Transcription antitermination protein RfaH n=2 Tax=Photobacterium TaxID=657 RepID=Q1Z807_9GAMM|nr:MULTISPECIES: transcription/translation regulatory transformer protein RfaH [Photobacterium]EAS44706.1 transcriptional activator RfaH [Photobacterium profundum 3TCK]PSV46758.1 transcription/translation regulatory transformer protein RfaH [Photobacterium indicum]PSV60692.1 transcription/translation regulatory transformer protein RfaH [Photobacterium profundum]